MSLSVEFVILFAALLGSGQPGDFERYLVNADGLLLVASRGDGQPCGVEDRPEVVEASVLDVIFGPFAEGKIEVLVVSDKIALQRDGTKAFWLLGRSTIEDGAGCPVAPSHAIKKVVPCVDSCMESRQSWQRYADEVRFLPPKGTARQRALVELWVATLINGQDELREHAARSLEETARSRPLSVEVLRRLRSVLVDCDPDPTSCLMTIRVLSRVVAPEHVGRHVFPGGSEEADKAREALLGALFDSSSEVRAMAVRGLAPLLTSGDRAVARHLNEISRTEDCPLVIEVLRTIRASSQMGSTSARGNATAEERIGLRMLLVLMGLTALLGMTLLPVVLRRTRGS